MINNIIALVFFLSTNLFFLAKDFVNKDNRSLIIKKQISDQKTEGNYKIKVRNNHLDYVHLFFHVTNKKGQPVEALIYLVDEKGNHIGGTIDSGETSTIEVMIYDKEVKFINVTALGFGRVKIPIEKVKSTRSDIRVYLNPAAMEL